jgi:tetratricopeptide (TPR) repeat protein
VIAALPRPLVAGLAVAALGGAIVVQSARDRWYPRAEAARTRVLYVRSPAAMKRLAFGFQALAADVYWIRAIQHYGGDRLDNRPDTAHRYELLYPLIDIATSLDPYFNIAYRFGAIFLGEPYPGGPGRPDQAVALLRKAIVAMPQKWQYYHDLAFVYYWRLHDFKAAGEWFQRAAEQPGAPSWLPSVAASMVTRSSDRATARFMWRQLLRSEQGWIRNTAERSLLQIQALDQIDQLRATVILLGPGIERRYGWSVLIARGVLPGVPLDPARTPYAIDPATGRVSVSPQSPLFPMPEEGGPR